ncbi:MAG TPA: dihydrofolate reductase family protein [Solirubrobacteraceae bacterium]|jgi:riboflavin-specific deaminase-like protein|nr:dihydrofolate reductase family protein [Solirubrobacteraceae bacterium]
MGSDANFQRLIPPGGECGAREALAGWREEPARGARRPRLALNMVASVDGRVTIGGRSAPLSAPADRELFHALRAEVDAVMAGAGTVRLERYGPIVRDADVRERRRAAGIREQPLAVIVSRSLDLPPDVPLLADPDSHVVVVGSGTAELKGARADVSYIRCETLADGLAELRSRFDIGLVVCEGGPRLAASLVRERVVDELFLSFSPQLVGGDPGPTMLADTGEPAPTPLELRQLLAAGGSLFARYVVG